MDAGYMSRALDGMVLGEPIAAPIVLAFLPGDDP